MIKGRPSKFNSKISRAILEDISANIPYKIAAQCNGICERALYYWIERGSKDMSCSTHSPYSDFLQSLRKIEKIKIKDCLDKILSSPNGHKGSQWILEHVFWRHFSPNAGMIELNERIEELEKI